LHIRATEGAVFLLAAEWRVGDSSPQAAEFRRVLSYPTAL
jgi:hypothetical protein